MDITSLTQEEKDIYYMREALSLAKEAEALDEVPVGAVLVARGKIVGRAKNERETLRLATRHAEISAIEEACQSLGGWRLPDSTLYVTLEPCVMCAGAIVNARVERVVFGAHDLRFGAFGSLLNLNDFALNHRPDVTGGVLAEECRQILTDYFKKKRAK